ncbi:MAG TPA: hypothetical protein VKU62_02275 [Thermoanaerobaculia bacterium]|nr:hypothetical protein [Thermoanaerobaculia bacterium]
MSPKLIARIVAAAIIGFAVGLLIAATEWLFISHPLGFSGGAYYGYGLLFAGFVRPIAVPLLWPARLLIPSAGGSPVATSVAILANALLYAFAAAVADRIYSGESKSSRRMP